MKKSFIFILTLALSGIAHAVDGEQRINNVFYYGKWVVMEFTMPTMMAYRIGTESNLPEQKQTAFIDISPLNHCEADKITINQFIGYKQMDFANVPFIPVRYKVSGQSTEDSITTPTISDGYLFTPIESMKVSELLQAKDKGNFSFWFQPPAESKESINKTFFPLNGFSDAYKNAVRLCKENM